MAVVFASLIAMACLVRAPLDEVANPADASYIPRPEWYFLSLFQLLKYFPGPLEPVATQVHSGPGGRVPRAAAVSRSQRASGVRGRARACRYTIGMALLVSGVVGADGARAAGSARRGRRPRTGGCCRSPGWNWPPARTASCRRCHVLGRAGRAAGVDRAPPRRGVAAQSHDRSGGDCAGRAHRAGPRARAARWGGSAPRPWWPICAAVTPASSRRRSSRRSGSRR